MVDLLLRKNFGPNVVFETLELYTSSVRPVVAVVLLCLSARPVVRSVAVVVLCSSVPVRPVVVRSLCVRPVVRRIITYMTSGGIRRMGMIWQCVGNVLAMS